MSLISTPFAAAGRRIVGSFAFLFLLLFHARDLGATVLPSGFTEFTFATGLSRPTALVTAPDGRMFVCEQSGRVRVIKNGALLSAPFVTVPATSNSEHGLLGIAFHPQFPATPWVYLYYTATQRKDGVMDIHHRVSRVTASGDVAVSGSEVILLEILDDDPGEWHNGGAMRFAKDG